MKRLAVMSREDQCSLKVKDRIINELSDLYIYDEDHPDLVISVGGDGTMLYSIHRYIDLLDEVCFLGLHTGTLGFYTDYLKEECDEMIHDIRTKQGSIFERYLLKVKYGEEEDYALNEVRIENNMQSLVMDVYIDEEHLETFRGNGLCVSTDSGSTAYNRSLRGAVIYPGNRVMQLSEIAGIHHNAYGSLESSLILDDSHKINIFALDLSHAVLGVDHNVYKLNGLNQVEIEISQRSARFIQYKPLSFVGRIKRAFIK